MNEFFEDDAQAGCLLVLKEQYKGHNPIGILPQSV